MPPTNSQTLTINDFRTGIVVDTRLGTISSNLDMPPGTANALTSGCYALTTGALAPMPGLIKTVDTLDQSFTMSAHMDQAAVMRPVGLYTVGPLAQDPGFPTWWAQNANFSDELHFMVEGKAAAGTHHSLEWHVRKLYVPTIPADNIITKDGIDQLSKPDVHGMTGITARLLNANFGNPGLPTFVTEWSESPLVTGGSKFVMFYPDPANTASDTVASNSVGPCQVLNFSGRVLRLDWIFYNHGANNGAYYTNEQIEYTDPPNSNTWTGNQPTVLDADNPNGYMSWGSLVYGEVIFFRQNGGAVVIDGDIYSPQVTILKGVKSAGNLMNVASPSDTGLVYCVADDGAYMWEGGNTSRKISTVYDRFYDRPHGNPTTGIAVKHCRYEHFIAFPNGFMFDILTEAWWRLDNLDSALVESGKGNPNLLYVAPDQFTTPLPVTVRVYNSNAPTDDYIWYSQTIRLADNTRIDLTRCTLSVEGVPAGGATVTIGVASDAGAYTTYATFNLSGSTDIVQRFSIPAGRTNLASLLFYIHVKATVTTQAAPVVTAISFDWQPSTILPQ